MFSLSFTVTERPPTIVTCSVDGNQFDISDGDLMRVVTESRNETATNTALSVQVTVLVRMRVAGQYQCSVTTDKITIDNEPSALTATRNITGKYLTCIFVLFNLF